MTTERSSSSSTRPPGKAYIPAAKAKRGRPLLQPHLEPVGSVAQQHHRGSRADRHRLAHAVTSLGRKGLARSSAKRASTGDADGQDQDVGGGHRADVLQPGTRQQDLR